jgi:hypothetical protein
VFTVRYELNLYIYLDTRLATQPLKLPLKRTETSRVGCVCQHWRHHVSVCLCQSLVSFPVQRVVAGNLWLVAVRRLQCRIASDCVRASQCCRLYWCDHASQHCPTYLNAMQVNLIGLSRISMCSVIARESVFARNWQIGHRACARNAWRSTR